MTVPDQTQSVQVLHCKAGSSRTEDLELIGEEPLLIRIDGAPYSVVMRTPGQELFHAAGFCLGEGIVDAPEDLVALGHCQDRDANVVDIRLSAQRREAVKDLLDRRGFVSQTSCGICGKELVKDLYQVLSPAKDGFAVDIGRVFDCIAGLSENQAFYRRTRGSHAAILYDDQLGQVAFAEDVGRHNALDKAVGNAFMHRKLPRCEIVVLSSRISYELVQKAARANLSVMISHSRPTALAAEMGRSLNMTLAFPTAKDGLTVVCGRKRIRAG
jgi:FdhD protein